MLVAVQLPNHLVIPYGREIEKRNSKPRQRLCSPAMCGIEMPVNLRAVIEVCITQQSEAMFTDRFRLFQNFVHIASQISLQRQSDAAQILSRQKEYPPRGTGQI